MKRCHALPLEVCLEFTEVGENSADRKLTLHFVEATSQLLFPERLLLFCKSHLQLVPDVSEQEGGLCGVLNRAKRQQDRVGHLQGVARNGGTERHGEVAVLALKFNVVFILTLVAATTQVTEGREITSNEYHFLCCSHNSLLKATVKTGTLC